MKLNPDCIREILLWFEENQSMEQGFNGFLTGNVAAYMSTDMPQYFKDYSPEDVLYSIKQMVESGLLNATRMDVDGADWYRIRDITPIGHDFLGNIRADNNWQKTKSIAKSIGSVTLSSLSKIAAKVIADLINGAV